MAARTGRIRGTLGWRNVQSGPSSLKFEHIYPTADQNPRGQDKLPECRQNPAIDVPDRDLGSQSRRQQHRRSALGLSKVLMRNRAGSKFGEHLQIEIWGYCSVSFRRFDLKLEAMSSVSYQGGTRCTGRIVETGAGTRPSGIYNCQLIPSENIVLLNIVHLHAFGTVGQSLLDLVIPWG